MEKHSSLFATKGRDCSMLQIIKTKNGQIAFFCLVLGDGRMDGIGWMDEEAEGIKMDKKLDLIKKCCEHNLSKNGTSNGGSSSHKANANRGRRRTRVLSNNSRTTRSSTSGTRSTTVRRTSGLRT